MGQAEHIEGASMTSWLVCFHVKVDGSGHLESSFHNVPPMLYSFERPLDP